MKPIPGGHVRVTVESPDGACFVALVQHPELKIDYQRPEHEFIDQRRYWGPSIVSISGLLKESHSEIRIPNPKPEPERL